MTRKQNPDDPKNLVADAFRIDGIQDAECRSIFLDWALSLPDDANHQASIDRLLATYGADNPGHPMVDILQQALLPIAAKSRRRSGRSRARN